MSYYKKKLRYWSDKEIKLLTDLYPKFRVKNIAEKFPRRTKATIVAKALSIGLPSAKLWQQKENKILEKYFKDSTGDDLSKFLPRRSWSAILAQGERLKLKRNRRKPRLTLNELYFKKWSPNMAYMLGFILADGCIVEGTYKGYSDSLKFGVQLKDKEILEKIKSELDAKHSISIVNNAAHLSISSQKIVDDLKRLGISYRKSLKEKIPKIPDKFIKDFIRGIVDGDGSVHLYKKNYPVLSITGGENVMRFIRDYFFNKFKLYSVLGQRSYSKKARHYLYNIVYKSNSAKVLIDYLYRNATMYLSRKYQLANECLKTNIKIRHNSKYRIKRYYETHTCGKPNKI